MCVCVCFKFSKTDNKMCNIYVVHFSCFSNSFDLRSLCPKRKFGR